jgi:hypothetical protein
VLVEPPLKHDREVWDVLVQLHVLMYQLSAGENVVGVVAQFHTNGLLKALGNDMAKVKSVCFA